MKKLLRSVLLVALLVTGHLSLITPVHAADITITAANVVASTGADRDLGVAGATILAGQAVYLDPATNSYKLADANAASPAYKVAGIALHGASSGQPLAVCTGDNNFTVGGTVAAGTIVILSGTAGGLAPSSDAVTGWYVQVFGVGIGGNKIKFNLIRSDSAVP